MAMTDAERAENILLRKVLHISSGVPMGRALCGAPLGRDNWWRLIRGRGPDYYEDLLTGHWDSGRVTNCPACLAAVV